MAHVRWSVLLEQRNDALALLRRLVVEFGPVDDDYGASICGYCDQDIGNTLRVREHDEGCAWRAAKQYVEGQGST